MGVDIVISVGCLIGLVERIAVVEKDTLLMLDALGYKNEWKFENIQIIFRTTIRVTVKVEVKLQNIVHIFK